MASISTSHSDDSLRPEDGFRCLYFDGKTSRPYDVVINIGIYTCTVKGPGVSREIRIGEISVSESFAGTSRLIKFHDGSYCEIDDSTELNNRLSEAGFKKPVSSRIHESWKSIAVSFILLVIIFASGYRWGLPFAAEIIAFKMPSSLLSYVTNQSLESIDGKWLFPSKISKKRQNSITASFRKIRLPGAGTTEIKVIFRNSDVLGANAFALPDGTIIFLDRLIEIADSNNELIAVFTHEAGHAVHRHSMRQVIQNSVVAAIIAVYIGDVSSIAGAISGWMLESKYSRDFEREADRYAAKTLTDNRLSPLLLGKILVKLEADHNRNKNSGKSSNAADYISTHPSTDERVKMLKEYIKK